MTHILHADIACRYCMQIANDDESDHYFSYAASMLAGVALLRKASKRKPAAPNRLPVETLPPGDATTGALAGRVA